MLYRIFKILVLITFINLVQIRKSKACHALPLVNITQQMTSPDGLQLTADSDAATCGCGPFWLEIEIRESNDSFDDSGLSPGFWGPLNSLPYFQSSQMIKPDCIAQTYPWVTIPDSLLCANVTYKYRMRENHNGQISPWSATQYFTSSPSAGSGAGNANYSVSNTCFDNTVPVFFNNTSVSNGPNTFWDYGDGTPNDTSINGSHIYSAPGQYQVTLNTGIGGVCGSIASKIITINPTPLVSFYATETGACDTLCTIFVDQSSISSGSIVSWDWDFGNGDISSLQYPIQTCYHAYLGGDSISYFSPQLLVTSDSGCSNVITYPGYISLQTMPNVDFVASNLCNNQSAVFTDLSTPDTVTNSWLWNFGDGTLSSQQNPSHLYAINGTYNVKLVVTNASSCSDSVTYPVTISSPPNANFTLDVNSGCDSLCVTFSDQSTVSGASIVDWNWIFNDGNTSNTQNATNCYHLTPADPNTLYYSPQLVITTSNGCQDSIILSDTILLRRGPKVMTNYQTTCDGDSVHFNNISSNVDTTTSWFWDFGDGSPLDLSESASHLYASTGSYNVSLMASNGSMCNDTSSFIITINPRPIASFNVSNSDGCLEVCTNFQDASSTSNGNIATWFWDFDNGNSSSLPSPSECFQGIQGDTTVLSYSPSLLVTSDSGCVDSVQYSNLINVFPSPTVPTIGLSGGDLVVSTPYGVQWYFNGSAILGETDTNHTALANGYYQVEVSNIYGCHAISDSVLMTTVGIIDNPETLIIIYPNPATTSIKIRTQSKDISKLTMINSTGQVVKELSFNAKNEGTSLNVEDLASGIYTMIFSSEEGMLVRHLMIE